MSWKALILLILFIIWEWKCDWIFNKGVVMSPIKNEQALGARNVPEHLEKCMVHWMNLQIVTNMAGRM